MAPAPTARRRGRSAKRASWRAAQQRFGAWVEHYNASYEASRAFGDAEARRRQAAEDLARFGTPADPPAWYRGVDGRRGLWRYFAPVGTDEARADLARVLYRNRLFHPEGSPYRSDPAVEEARLGTRLARGRYRYCDVYGAHPARRAWVRAAYLEGPACAPATEAEVAWAAGQFWLWP